MYALLEFFYSVAILGGFGLVCLGMLLVAVAFFGDLS